MATKENMNYLRIMLLLLDGGTTILRAFLRREVKRTKAGMDMITGCELWDFDHLCDTILHQFSPIPLATDEMVYVLALRDVRVYVLLANQDSVALDEEDFAHDKYELADVLRTLSRCLDMRYQDYIEHKITQILSGPIDAETSITVLKKQFSINQEFQHLQDKLENILKQIPQQLNVPTNVFDANAFELWEKSQENVNEEAVGEDLTFGELSVGEELSAVGELSVGGFDVLHPIKTEILDKLKHIEALLQEQNKPKEILDILKHIEALLQEQNKSKEILDMLKHIEALLQEQNKSKVTPLDVVKIRLQAQKKPQAFSKGHCYLYCNGMMDHMCICFNENGRKPPQIAVSSRQWYKCSGNFNGTMDAFRKIITNEGLASLWSGLPPTLVMAVPSTVVYFTTYEQLKSVLGHKNTDIYQNWWKPVVAGGSARVFAATVISPLEMVRTKLQSEQLSYRQVTTAVYKTIQSFGVLSMWKGLGPTLMRDVPFSRKKEVTLTFRLMHNLYREHGVCALFSGLTPRIAKVAPACAVMITSFEFFKSFFQRQNIDKLK